MGDRKLPAECDLVIVGAGPAGLSTALFLHQIDPGWADRTLVLEKATHPRPKLCAGGITRFGLRLLDELGLQFAVPHIPISSALLEFEGKRALVEGDPIFVVTERPAFDAWLADRARARSLRLVEGIRVRDLAWEEGRMIVETEQGVVRARVVVCAEGSKGKLRHRIASRRRSVVARTLELVIPVAREHAQFSERQARFIFDETTSRLQGYTWAFPSLCREQSCINTGVYDACLVPVKGRADLVSILRRALQDAFRLPIDVAWKSHPIHLFTPRNLLSAERMLLVGDAAGADPLFGEGIGLALGYGKVAARSIQQAFSRGDFRFSGYRQHVMASAVGRYLIIRWFLASGIYSFSGSRVFMHFLLRLSRVLASILGPH